MNILRPIRTGAEHADAMAEIHRLWGSEPGTPAGDMLEVLAILVEAYEREHHPLEPPTPAEAAAFRAEQMGVPVESLAQRLDAGPFSAVPLGLSSYPGAWYVQRNTFIPGGMMIATAAEAAVFALFLTEVWKALGGGQQPAAPLPCGHLNRVICSAAQCDGSPPKEKTP